MRIKIEKHDGSPLTLADLRDGDYVFVGDKFVTYRPLKERNRETFVMEAIMENHLATFPTVERDVW